jgi:uncharacterized protein YegP (UPF0339 family)
LAHERIDLGPQAGEEMSVATIQVFTDKAGEYRWRKMAANGSIVADSGEGYSTRGAAWEAAQREAQEGDRVVQVAPENGAPPDAA